MLRERTEDISAAARGGVAANPPPCLNPNLRKRKARTAMPRLGTYGRRDNMVKDLDGGVYLVENDFFYEGLLPELPDGADVDAIKSTLIEDGVLNPSGEGWTDWTSKPSEHKGTKEDDVFVKLENLIKHIKNAWDPVSVATLRFVCKPTKTPKSTTNPSSSKPDAFGIKISSDQTTETDDWIDISIPAEFKKGDDARAANDNCVKVLWSMDHLMREDPRRRFVYGFTIEDNKMRMWFTSRSEAFASYYFDWHQHPEKVIKFFLPLLFASEEDLGWDTTIKRHSPRTVEGPAIQYDIEVGDTVYRTQRLISDAGAQLLRGRGTRVWEVRELKDGEETGPSLVLKDVWADEDRDSEKTISDKIHDSGGEKERSVFKKHLIQILHEADVKVQRGQQKVTDHTHRIMRRGQHPVSAERLFVVADYDLAKLGPKSGPHPTGITSLPVPRPVTPPRYCAKIHRRIIFEDVAKTIEEADKLSRVFLCLGHVIRGLCAMHKNGWVHRDISAGNVLIHDRRGKLSDVEYAKHKSDTTRHEIRTGTPYFMSTEVEETNYLHQDDFDGSESSDDDDDEDDDDDINDDDINDDDMDNVFTSLEAAIDAKPQADGSATQQSRFPLASAPGLGKRKLSASDPPEETFRYNPLHDMESIFWLALWMLICVTFERNDPSISEEKWAAYMKQHAIIANKIYDSGSTRITVLLSRKTFKQHLGKALPQVRKVAKKLSRYRRLILTAFRKTETSPGRMDPTFDPKMYTKAMKIFAAIGRGLLKKDLVILQQPAEKRKRVKRVPKTYPPPGFADDSDSGDDSDNDGDDAGDAGDAGPSRPRKARKMAAGASATGTRMTLRSAAKTANIRTEG
ncbi:hypothetical protein PsYK624_136280 [Phanerochaete sordida]|uniref:Fungal-type protein kinase domain-containing protein n=1 Tax=Phanerochaete sordida TaxID=48140 RepID=A0A9P3GMD2_9APHY|nr:hypothetical protein PsYK624_136280 [Phanerochaete sordida]